MTRDEWADGDAYEAYIGRWSRLVAPEFLGRLRVPAGGRWLDVGCGTGALASTILASNEPAYVVGVDPSVGFLATAYARIRDPRTAFCAADARALPFADGTFAAVVSALALNFVPDPRRAARELARVAAPGGTVAAYVWDYAGGMAMLRYFWDAAVVVDPDAAALDEAHRFPLCRSEPLAELWSGAGLTDVRVAAIDVPTAFTGFDDYWRPFLGGQGAAPGYVASLPDDRRTAVRELLRSRLPAGPDGSIRLTARAWTVSGVAPVSSAGR